MTINWSKINWKQPKYVLPAILYLPLIGVGYLFIDLFQTDKAEVATTLQTTEYLNPTLPEARLRDDGIGGKRENMARSYGQIQDYSAVESINQNEEDVTEQYNSKYTEEDLAMLAADAEARQAEMERIQAMQDRLEHSAATADAMAGDDPMLMLSEEERLMAANRRQSEALDELNAALASARQKGQEAVETVTGTVEAPVKTENAVTVPGDDEQAGKVVKKLSLSSDYFHTICENDPEPNLIKAIIDEDIKAVEGSRVRLRLLDDVEIDGTVIAKGTYFYATMSGFGQQRVKGSIQSMLVHDELVKVNLSIYDTDGLEGLYVPQSQFRETTKDIASGAMSNSMTVNSGGYDNSFTQWGMQSLQNAVTKTTDAISKAIKKNKAKLKYGTFVYLVNGKETRN